VPTSIVAKRHYIDLPSLFIGDQERSMLKAAPVPKSAIQHSARNHIGVFARLFVAGK
jgi:hypothetical protein